jgi:conserved repeat protein
MSEKKVGKRLLTWVLVLVMTLSLLPLNVLAANPAVMRIVRPDTDKYITYNFYLNEGDKTPYYSQIIKNNESLDAPATPEKKDYKFVGWYDGDEQFSNFGTAITVTEGSTDVDLYAKFVPVCYVYFMDGTGEGARIIATKEVTATDPLNDFSDVAFPIGADEAITGWVDKDNNPVTSVSFSDGTTYLYPVVEKGHWIEFNSNGGSYVAPLFVAKNAQLSSLPEPTKHGYSFDSWYTDKEMTNKFESDNDLSDDLTLYAKWNPSSNVSYTVIHWLENADDDNYSLAASESKSGITGSKTEATAKTYVGFTSPAAKDIEQETIAGDGSTIVNVYYKRNMYEVKFSSYSYTDWRGHSHPGTEYTSLRITAKYGANISDKWPTYNGSSTWSTNDNENKGPYQVNIQTMPLGGANFYGPKTGRGSETAYYYVESLTGGKYELHHSDTTPGTGYSVTDEDRYPITGFTFKTYTAEQGGNWFDGYYEKYDGARFYYTRNSYNIVFINGGAEDKTLSKKYQQDISDANYTPTAPAGKVGYEFAGWYDNELCEGTAYNFTSKTMPANNITLYAKWVEPVHKVEFLVDNKVVTKWTKTDVAHNSTISDLPTPTSSNGDTFLGWVDANGKPFHPSTKITGDLKLYAKFGNKTGYSVTYVTAEGSSSFTDDKLYAEGAYATVRDGASTAPAGKVFLYWNASSDSSGKKYYPNDKVLVPKGGVTLTAVYGDKAETVTLTYNANFGTPPASTQISGLKNNGLIDLLSYDELELPKRDGYTFTGWNTQQDGHGISFAAGTSAARVDKVEPNVLYAQWKKTTIDEEVTVIITGKTDTKVYNGSEQSVTGYEVKSISNELYKTTDFTFNGTATATGTDADTYQMGLKPENFENKNANFSKVTFVVTDGSLTITKRDVTLTSASASKPYDGTALTSKNVTVGGNGFADGEGATYNVTGSQTEVGKSDNEFTYELNANTKANNYNITMYKGELVITAADSVAYKVEHYKQNLDGSYNDTPNDIDPLSGTAGTLTAAAAKDYPGFTPGTVTQEKIKSDGTTTVEIQYTRNSYTLTINYVYRDGSKAAESHIETILYGKDYSVTSPKISGYTADKLVVSGTMPADNRTVTVTYTKNGGHHPRPKPTVEIEDDDALGLNTTDHFAYIVGYGNGEVRPQNNITRAEVATIFFRLLTDDVRDENLTKTNRYSDVAATSWYNTAVSTLSSMGIITGYPDGTFRPNAAITRAEFAAIAARFDHDGDKTAAKFSDIASHWAKDEISIAYNNGWITGYPNSTFGPQRDITRAETMTLVNRVLNRQPETEDDLLPNMTVWTDNANPKAWYYLAVQEATNSHYYEFKTNSQYEKWTELRETRDWTQLEK